MTPSQFLDEKTKNISGRIRMGNLIGWMEHLQQSTVGDQIKHVSRVVDCKNNLLNLEEHHGYQEITGRSHGIQTGNGNYAYYIYIYINMCVCIICI